MLDWWLPESLSTFSGEIDTIFHFIYWLTNITFLLVAGTMVWFLIKYRHQPGRKATYVHGNTTLEIVWTSATTLIVLGLALWSRPVWAEIKMQQPPADVEVRITGKQFNWEILYPGPDGKLDSPDDVQVDNVLHVPVNKNVLVHLMSKDVIHSFFVPVLRLKQDAMPGRTIPVWFNATKAGRYELPCAELCGFGHSGMLGYLVVDSPESYAAWIAETWPTTAAAAPAEPAPTPVPAEGTEPAPVPPA